MASLIPGVPPLLNKIGNVGNKVILLVADASRVLGLFSNAAPQWGIYKNKKLALKPDSIVSIEAKTPWLVSDYPMEKGAFQSYNKVKQPREARVRMNKGGAVASRTQFFLTLKAMASSLDVYDIYMPEGALQSMTLVSYEFVRTATSGISLVSFDVHFVEVMQTVTPAFTNTAVPEDGSPAQGGTVQTQEPTPGQRSTLGAPPTPTQ